MSAVELLEMALALVRHAENELLLLDDAFDDLVSDDASFAHLLQPEEQAVRDLARVAQSRAGD